jgi:hypothetical protein
VSGRVLVCLLVLIAGCAAPEETRALAVAATEAVSSPGPCTAPGACYAPPRLVGTFDAEVVPEASGLAASARNPGLYYLLDDGPQTKLWVLDPEAGLLGAVRPSGLDGRDTEALAVGPCGPGDPTTCVYVGDIGDNRRGRDGVRIWRFVEPDLSAGIGGVGADAITLRYPDESWDAEALLVDANGVPHLLTKAPFDEEAGVAGPSRLYRAEGWSDGTMTFLGELAPPPPRAGLAAPVVGNVVTGADRSGDRVLVRTYDAVVEYVAPSAGAPLDGLPSWPSAEIRGPFLAQAEAVAYAADGCGFLTVAEGSGDVWAVPCD